MEKVKIIPFWSWFRATGLGVILGIIATTFLFGLSKEANVTVREYSIVGFGIGIGYMQYRVLRKIHGVGKLWIWQSTFGVLTACWLVDIVRYIFNLELGAESNVVVAKILMSSLCLGAAQALQLRKMRYKDWYIYFISNVAPFALLFVIMVFIALQTGYLQFRYLLGPISAITFLVAYPMFNAIALKYIQEKTFTDIDANSEIEE